MIEECSAVLERSNDLGPRLGDATQSVKDAVQGHSFEVEELFMPEVWVCDVRAHREDEFFEADLKIIE